MGRAAGGEMDDVALVERGAEQEVEMLGDCSSGRGSRLQRAALRRPLCLDE